MLLHTFLTQFFVYYIYSPDDSPQIFTNHNRKVLIINCLSPNDNESSGYLLKCISLVKTIVALNLVLRCAVCIYDFTCGFDSCPFMHMCSVYAFV